jgi:V8-like Glu-specific endopeptidase
MIKLKLKRTWQDEPFELRRIRSPQVLKIPNDWWGRHPSGSTVRTIIKSADAEISGKQAFFSGYPEGVGSRQQERSGRVADFSPERTAELQIGVPISYGHSGSPVWIKETDKSGPYLRLIGVATKACGGPGGDQDACARILNLELLNNFTTWIMDDLDN